MRRYYTMGVCVAMGLAMAAACSEATDEEHAGVQEDAAAGEARRAVLSSLGERVILATYEEFEAKAEALEGAAAAWASSLDAADHDAARQAWVEAMDVWQRAEMFQVGPAGAMGAVVGGEDLRDQIYSWPLTNPCRVDQELVEQAYADEEAFGSESINVRGLDALEYLLFYEGEENACAPNSLINSDGSWAALSEEELGERRARYALTLASNLSGRATALRQAWDPAGANFLGELSAAGAASETYPTSQEALNAISDAIFYLDKEVKDMKLARPTGMSDCVEEVCPEARESPWANRSMEHLRQNLVGLQQIYLGGMPEEDALGFDDLLRGMGADQLADDLAARIAEAIARVDAVEGTMVEALETQPQAVVDVYDASRSITDLIKSQFFDVLDLEVPKRGEGDND